MNTNHYPDFERCKKLTEIGFPMTNYRIYENGEIDIDGSSELKSFTRPSVMEMLDVMPERIYNGESMYSIYLKPTEEEWISMYKTYDNNTLIVIHPDTLPNALADMILWLHEKKYISFTK